MIAQMDQQMARMNQQMARQSMVPGMNVVSYGNVPAGTNSVSVYTVSNGGHSCTRTTEVVSQGEGKPPKVTTKTSGECGPETAIAPPAAPAVPQTPHAPAAPKAPTGVGPIDHT
jgi:hypothetical protein